MKNKVIILIHGIGNNPPKNIFQELWISAILKNLSIENKNLNLEKVKNCFEMFYWSNFLPQKNKEVLEKAITETKTSIENLFEIRYSLKEKFHSFPNTNLHESPYFLSKNNFFSKKEIINMHFEIVSLYFQNIKIRKNIQKSLIELIKKSWENNKEIMLISHSFGSILAYETIWALNSSKNKIKYLITTGSPIAYEEILSKLNFAIYDKDNINFYPKIIENWHNYICYNDILTFNLSLKEVFFEFMKKHNLLLDYREYINLFNPYLNKDLTPNHHKSFGYLAQPKLAKWINKFLQE